MSQQLKEKSLTSRFVGQLVQSSPGEVAYEDARRFTSAQYQHYFNCGLDSFMPSCLSLYDDDGLVACVGYRAALHQDLFLEQYLEGPVESFLEVPFGRAVGRSKIVEIGCFAVRESKHAVTFMMHLAPLFFSLGFEVAVCTATRQIRCLFRQLAINTHVLVEADERQLTESDENWGEYYRHAPMVMAGDIKETLSGFAI